MPNGRGRVTGEIGVIVPKTALIRCPACCSAETKPFRTLSAREAGEHFVPRLRDAYRHWALVDHITRLWGQDHVELCRCGACGFGFPDPYVSGDAAFYNLVSSGDPHYPKDRWEYGRTIAALHEIGGGSLLECGAGDGQFLRKVDNRFHPTALDYDVGALRRLHAMGIEAMPVSVTDLAQSSSNRTFRVVCLFQVLEHMAPVDDVFAALRRVTEPGGDVFVSVPNGHAIDQQEALAGFADMPPNHVGRWYPESLHRMCERLGIEVRRMEVAPANRWSRAWQLSYYRGCAHAYSGVGLHARVASVRSRPVRGALRYLLAVNGVARMSGAAKIGDTLWAQLRFTL